MIYALLIQDAHPEDADRPAGEEDGLLAGHRAIQADANERGELKSVARLEGKSSARTLRRKGDSFQVADGPYLETKEWLVGFYLMECENEAVAVARAERICPPNGSVEIRPVAWMP
jgi:hypothetical protein